MSLQFELLEERLLLAASINTRNGVLQIKSDNAGDIILVEGTGDGGPLRVGIDADGSGAIEADEITEFAGITSIKANLRGGNDTLTIDGVNLSGDVKINSGSGDDVVLIGRQDPNTISGKTNIRLGGNNDIVGLQDTAFGGRVSINGGQGTNIYVDAGGNTGLEDARLRRLTPGDLDDLPVVPPIDGPDAVDDALDVLEGGVLDIDLGDGLLSNDIDVDGSGLTIIEINDSPANVGVPVDIGIGDVTVDPDGSLMFVPDADLGLAAGETASATFTYTVSDGDGTDEATATVTVTGVDGLPAVVDGVLDFALGAVDTVGNLVSGAGAPIVDPDGDPLSIVGFDVDGVDGILGTAFDVLDGLLGIGTLTVAADGSFTFSPSAINTGTATLTVTVDDGSGAPTDLVLTIDVS